MEVEGAGVGTQIARVFEFSLICGYFLFLDRKIGYRLKDLRMKCNSLIKDYVSISIPVFIQKNILTKMCKFNKIINHKGTLMET